MKTTGFSFKQKEVKDRGVTEISIGTSVDADYPAIIEFINGLERSKYFYLLDEVQLNSGRSWRDSVADWPAHIFQDLNDVTARRKSMYSWHSA